MSSPASLGAYAAAGCNFVCDGTATETRQPKKRVSFDPALHCPHIESDLESVASTLAPDDSRSPSQASSQSSPAEAHHSRRYHGSDDIKQAELSMMGLDLGPREARCWQAPREAPEGAYSFEPANGVEAADRGEVEVDVAPEVATPVRVFSHRRIRSNSGCFEGTPSPTAG